MTRLASANFVRAFLPVIPLAFCHGCGSSGESAPASGQGSGGAASIQQTGANHAPSISGAAVEYARVGMTYDYLPTATDADGDALHFSAINLPPWASIDPTNGHITGTPGETDQGIYESITITVADASREAVTQPFSITVLDDAATGVASLQWERPPSKVDGSPLDDLAGYRILYGRTSDDLDKSVFVSDPNSTSYQFTALSPGIWYFAVVGVNASGLEGMPTTVASKSI